MGRTRATVKRKRGVNDRGEWAAGSLVLLRLMTRVVAGLGAVTGAERARRPGRGVSEGSVMVVGREPWNGPGLGQEGLVCQGWRG
jgi:hypothetical protein